MLQIVRKASWLKRTSKLGCLPAGFDRGLAGRTVALMFNKRSTRTRVSTEAAVAAMGGHPLFLGKDDIQLGVNESLLDTSRVISSMTSCMVARVGPHQHVLDLAKYSSVPVINALSDRHHPMQAVADLLTMFETRQLNHDWEASLASMQEMFKDMRIAWVGDANNVLFDLAIAATRLGMHIAVATPKGYEIPEDIRLEIERPHVTSERPAGTLLQTTDPAEAVHNADFVVTDTWVSMGQEENKTKRLRDFEGFQVTSELLARGGARGDCRFMHCMPRHPEEVSDELFYGPRSLVFQEAENRLWAAMAVIQDLVVVEEQMGKLRIVPSLSQST